MKPEEEFLSLYDYLGHAAGIQLGAQVHKAATLENQPTKIRRVSNPKYTGDVNLYTKAFLDSYFIKVEQKSINDDELPF